MNITYEEVDRRSPMSWRVPTEIEQIEGHSARQFHERKRTSGNLR